MRKWTLSDVKDRLVEVFRLCEKEPQVVYDQNQPIGVIVDVTFFNQLMNLRKRQHRPTIAELLDELSEIHKTETIELEVLPRQDRPNAMVEAAE